MATRRVSRRRRRRSSCQTLIEFALVLPVFLLALLGSVDAAMWSVETDAAVSAAEQAARIAASALGNPAGINSQGVRYPIPASNQDLTDAIKGTLQTALFSTRVRAWCSTRCTSSTPCTTPPTCPVGAFDWYDANDFNYGTINDIVGDCNGCAVELPDDMGPFGDPLQGDPNQNGIGAEGAEGPCPTTPQQVATTLDPTTGKVLFGYNTVVVCSQIICNGCTLPGLTGGNGDPPMVTVRIVGYVPSLIPNGLGLGLIEIPINVGASTHTLKFTP